MHELKTLPGRVVVCGTTGSGKSTTARRIGAIIAAPHVELDALYWGSGWTPASPETFRQRVDEATRGDAWVVDGNYSTISRDVHWPRAQTLVWLDYSIARVFARLFRRSLRRSLRGEELWNGNRERLRLQFLSRDSLFIWALKTHWKHRREFPEVFREPPYAHLRIVRARSPRHLEQWLASLAQARVAAPGTGAPPRTPYSRQEPLH